MNIKLFIILFTDHSFHGIGVADISIVSHFLSCKKLCSFLAILVRAANSSHCAQVDRINTLSSGKVSTSSLNLRIYHCGTFM